MIVLHGWWSVSADPMGALVVWAEDSTAPAEPPRRPGRRAKTQAHPFSVASADLAAAFNLSDTVDPVIAASAVLLLPGAGRGPAASPELVADRLVVDEQDQVSGPSTAPARWTVPTLVLDADDALALLWPISREARDIDAPRHGGDLRYLSAMAGFATDLVARARVLPTVARHGPGLGVAMWRPIVTGADAEWLRAAASARPPVSIAADQPQSVAAAVDALVDAVVRSRLAQPASKPRKAAKAQTPWRAALIGPGRVFRAPDAEVSALADALAQWASEALGGGAVRACFRLVEPAAPLPADGASVDEDDGWRLEFALQAADEPSLVVDADQVWRSKGSLRALARHVPDPQETLLAELGRAVRLYPDLGRALRTAKPSVLTLGAVTAHDFLVEAVPLLVAAGFGVLLPGWWTNPSARVGARLKVSTPSQPGAVGSPAGIGQDGLVDFDWQLAVGEHTLTEQELDDLVEAQQPLVRVRGQWLYVDHERLAQARAFLQRQAKSAGGRMSLGEVLHSLGTPDEGPGGLPVLSVEADGWLGDLLSPQSAKRLEPVTAPPGFVGSLRPYQERGLAWLTFLEAVGMGGILADDMGLGKTIQLLALIARDLADESATGLAPTLLVCPMSLVGNWQREAARFTPHVRVHVHHGAERPRGKDFDAAVASSDLVVTTYALLARDAAALRKVPWRRLVLDEAQAVKNAATKAAVAARSIPVQHRIAVTGTPVENRLADLWSLMEFANPRLLGTPKQFKDRFATPIERHGNAEAGIRLRALTQPFTLRRLKTDSSIITDLPAKLEMEVVCSLTSEQAALYQAVVADMLERIATTDGIERRGLVLATMTKLKQVCNHPAQFLGDGSRLAGRSGKLARLEETLDEVMAAGEKALLFTQYATFGAMMRSHLSARFGREVAYLHGGVAKADRDTMVARFQDGGRATPPLFVLSLKAGGTGLNLTAANHVVHVDRWWNPAVEDQATDRAYRIGQTKPVQVRKFVCAGTLEEKIAAMIRDKRGLAASIVGTGEGWLTELSTTALRELFALEPGAVVE